MQHSQVMSNQDDETWAPQVNQQGGTKPKFYTLHHWVLCHFTQDKQTNAWKVLGKHATLSTW